MPAPWARSVLDVAASTGLGLFDVGGAGVEGRPSTRSGRIPPPDDEISGASGLFMQAT